jgi:hypothetical protein
MASLRKRGRVWYYRYVDGDGTRRERKGCPDKRATEELARAAESEAARLKAGLIDLKALTYRQHEARPLSEHVGASMREELTSTPIRQPTAYGVSSL